MPKVKIIAVHGGPIDAKIAFEYNAARIIAGQADELVKRAMAGTEIEIHLPYGTIKVVAIK